ncbi:MAG: hypothetical protein SPK06_06015 [Kiritimatiellia bacterium]|nr:hypothetical protein [Kiritimatiellia bacterium]
MGVDFLGGTVRAAVGKDEPKGRNGGVFGGVPGGFEAFSAPEHTLCAASDEGWNVGSKGGGEGFESRDGEVEVPKAVEGVEGGGAVAGASAEAGAGGDALGQVDSGAEGGRGFPLKEAGGAQNEVVFGGAEGFGGNLGVGGVEKFEGVGGGEAEGVEEGDGDEQAVEFVEAVGADWPDLEG